MKKIRFWFAGCLLAVPLVLAVWGFLLPAQYRETFPGELAVKCELLAQDAEKTRLVLVGAALPPSGWTAPCWKSSCRSIKWSTSGCTPRWVPA